MRHKQDRHVSRSEKKRQRWNLSSSAIQNQTLRKNRPKIGTANPRARTCTYNTTNTRANCTFSIGSLLHFFRSLQSLRGTLQTARQPKDHPAFDGSPPVRRLHGQYVPPWNDGLRIPRSRTLPLSILYSPASLFSILCLFPLPPPFDPSLHV